MTALALSKPMNSNVAVAPSTLGSSAPSRIVVSGASGSDDGASSLLQTMLKHCWSGRPMPLPTAVLPPPSRLLPKAVAVSA